MAYVDNWSRSFKNIYLISTFDAEPDWNRFPPKINKNFNPGISWHHLARRISLHKSADVSEISASVHEEGFSFISVQDVNDRAWAIPFVWMHLQGSKCPKFENPDPVLIPVGYNTRISFEGMNLERYQVKWH